ncbi:DUF2059 domain-containing protein [Rhizobium sp. CRIBSB]|nr:DUF2059 domain-containing protein [Rhizobium sp. CRIBSB]
MKRLLIVGSSLFLLLAAGGMPAAAQTPPKPAAVAEADTPSARQLALSRRYIELMQGEQIEDLVATMIQSSAMSDPNMRDMPQEDRDFLLELTTELTTELMPQMFEQLVPVYARAFTEAELEALIAFYDTELGRSIVAKTMETMPEANEAMMAVVPGMLEKMFSRLCAHYGCTEEEQQMFRDELGISPPVVVRPSGK